MHKKDDNDNELKKQKTVNAIDRYANLVYGIARTQLKYRSEADDVYQEVFFTYFEKDVDFSDEDHEKAWLIKTTVNICKRHNFSPWKLNTVPLSQTSYEESRVVLATEEETRVYAELRSLKPKYKLPMYLHYFNNMPVEKIAETLGIKKDAVKKQLQRGREIMKQRLECDYYE